MMDGAGLGKEVRIVVMRSNGVDFMSLSLQGADKIHPEIVNIPGGVKHNGDFHELVAKTRQTAQKWGFLTVDVRFNQQK
jgi:hypothetical protein